MNMKLSDRIRANYNKKPTSELLEIWKNNNREEYSDEAFEVVEQILVERNEPLPEQDEHIEYVEYSHISQEEQKKLIRKAGVSSLLWGAINITYWYINYLDIKDLIMARFSEIKPLLWFALYGILPISVLMIFIGFMGLLFRKPIAVLLNGLFLLFIGLWNLTSEFLIIPAFAQYNIKITLDQVLNEGNKLWYIIGVFQLYWGFREIKDYIKLSPDSNNQDTVEFIQTATPDSKIKLLLKGVGIFGLMIILIVVFSNNLNTKPVSNIDRKDSPVIKTANIYMTTNVSITEQMKKEYIKILSIDEKFMSDDFISSRISTTIGNILYQYGVQTNKVDQQNERCSLTLDLEMDLFPNSELSFSNGKNKTKTPICSGNAFLICDEENTIWESKISDIWMGYVMEADNNKIWQKILDEIGTSLCSSAVMNGVVSGFKKADIRLVVSDNVLEIIENINSPDRPLFDLTIRMSGEIGDIKCVDPLIRFLDQNKFKSGTPNLAVESLGKIGGQRVVEYLVQLLNEFPTDEYEFGQGVFLSYLLSAMSENAQQNSSVTAAMISKYGQMKPFEYKESIAEYLAKIESSDAKAFLEKLSN